MSRDYRIRIVKVVSGKAEAHLRFRALSPLNLVSVVFFSLPTHG